MLHFENSGRTYKNCGDVTTKLKRYLKKKDNDIYIRLKPYLRTAINNAKALGSFEKENPEKGMCEMHEFFLCDEFKSIFTSI